MLGFLAGAALGGLAGYGLGAWTSPYWYGYGYGYPYYGYPYGGWYGYNSWYW